MTEQSIRLDDLIEQVVDTHPEGDALQHLFDAVQTSTHLGEVADHLVGHFVDQARRSGATWTEIGQHMGVSKQAAQQRFVPKDSEADADFPTRRRLNRFTLRAQRVIKQAKTQAQSLGHDQITNEHLVLALIGEPDGLAAKIIVALGVPLEQVKTSFLAVVTPGRKSVRSRGRFGGTAKKTIELSLREAMRLGDNYIGTEHLLLGLLRNDQEVAAKLLSSVGVTADKVDAQLRVELALIRKPEAAS